MKVEALDKVKRWHVIYTKSKWEKLRMIAKQQNGPI